MSARGLLGVCLFGALGVTGCSSIRVTLLADANTNQGRPLQVLVRSIDEQSYRAESYSGVSRLVTAPNDSVLRKLVVDPRAGYRRSFCVRVQKGQPVALYFLYTSAIGHWKMMLSPPLPFAVRIPLRRSGIAVEDVQERRLSSPDSPPPSMPALPTLPSAPSAPTLPSAPSAPTAPSLPSIPAPPAPPPLPT
jgi:hypothetical protein